MATPKRDRGRPAKHQGPPDKQGRTGVPLSLRLAPELSQAITDIRLHFLQKNGVKLDKTQVVEMGIRKLCAEFGIEIPETPSTDKA